MHIFNTIDEDSQLIERLRTQVNQILKTPMFVYNWIKYMDVAQ